MSATAKMHRIDDDGRPIWDDDEVEELTLEEDGALDLDQSWQDLQSLLDTIGGVTLFLEEKLESRDVAKLAAKLQKLDWEEVIDLEVEMAHDREYVQPYFEAFRKFVLAAAAEGSNLRLRYQ